MYFYEKRYYRDDGEVYVKSYSRSFEIGEDSHNTGEPAVLPARSAEAALSRARSTMKELVFMNPDLTGFLTLTQRDCPSEEEANHRFAMFRKKVSRQYKGWKFVGVKELQKRGSIHWHLLVNFCPGEVPAQKKGRFNCSLWDYGFSDFARLDADENFRVELYLLKYLTKNHQKIFSSYYVRSRNLTKIDPKYISTKEPFHPLAENVFTKFVSNDFIDKFVVNEYTYNVAKFYKERERYEL